MSVSTILYPDHRPFHLSASNSSRTRFSSAVISSRSASPAAAALSNAARSAPSSAGVAAGRRGARRSAASSRRRRAQLRHPLLLLELRELAAQLIAVRLAPRVGRERAERGAQPRTRRRNPDVAVVLRSGTAAPPERHVGEQSERNVLLDLRRRRAAGGRKDGGSEFPSRHVAPRREGLSHRPEPQRALVQRDALAARQLGRVARVCQRFPLPHHRLLRIREQRRQRPLPRWRLAVAAAPRRVGDGAHVLQLTAERARDALGVRRGQAAARRRLHVVDDVIIVREADDQPPPHRTEGRAALIE